MLKIINAIASYAALMFVLALIFEQRFAKFPSLRDHVFRRYFVSWLVGVLFIGYMFLTFEASKGHLLLAASISAGACWAVAKWVEKRPK